MTISYVLLDLAPPGVSIAAGALLGGAVILIAAALAVIAFKLLKRSLRMAFRIAIAAVILLIAIVISLAVFVFSFGFGDGAPAPEPTLRRK